MAFYILKKVVFTTKFRTNVEKVEKVAIFKKVTRIKIIEAFEKLPEKSRRILF